MIELALFASTIVVVFALGFQQQNVTGGHYRAAFLTSFVIGGAYLFLYKLVPDAGPSEMAAYLAGGPFGITAGMWVHTRTLGKKRLQDADLLDAVGQVLHELLVEARTAQFLDVGGTRRDRAEREDLVGGLGEDGGWGRGVHAVFLLGLR